METNPEGHTQKDDLLPVMPAHKFQAPFGILNKYTRRSQLKRLRPFEPHDHQQKKLTITSSHINEAGSLHCQFSSSATSIFRTAISMKKIQSHPEIGTDGKHLKLALCLLDAAEKFSCQKYDEAENLLSFVILASSDHAGHPIERLVKYFALDLMERIDQEKGKFDLERQLLHLDLNEALMDLTATIHEYEQKFPFRQLTHFTVIQTVLDSVDAYTKRIHFIDISVHLGSSHWIVMMDALTNRSKSNGCPLKKLKITSIRRCKDIMGRTGELLSSSAESQNLPFVFNALVYSEIDQLKKDVFELEAGEVVIVYLESCLASLSAHPEKIEALIQTVKSLEPSLMILSEIEAKTSTGSSPSTFVDRFHEGLSLCSAMFDCHEACLGRENKFRQISERVYFQEIVRNCFLDPEDEDESFKRCLGIEFWREYLGRFGIVGMELSQASLYQVGLMIRENGSWGPCTVDMNDKCMVLGWDGTPLHSVSAWRFQSD